MTDREYLDNRVSVIAQESHSIGISETANAGYLQRIMSVIADAADALGIDQKLTPEDQVKAMRKMAIEGADRLNAAADADYALCVQAIEERDEMHSISAALAEELRLAREDLVSQERHLLGELDDAEKRCADLRLVIQIAEKSVCDLTETDSLWRATSDERLKQLEAVVAALPKCNAIERGVPCVQTAISFSDTSGYFYCDIHSDEANDSDLPYVSALRALESSCSPR